MSRLDGQLMMQRVIGLIKALRLHLQFVNQYLSGQIYVIASSGKGIKYLRLILCIIYLLWKLRCVSFILTYIVCNNLFCTIANKSPYKQYRYLRKPKLSQMQTYQLHTYAHYLFLVKACNFLLGQHSSNKTTYVT